MESLRKNEEKEYSAYLEECSAGLPPGASLLECGCGLGHSSKLLSLRGCAVTGTDISPLFVEEARKKHGETAALKFQVEDAARMSFPDRAFDVVCSALFLEHTSEVEKVLGEMVRVLKPGGKLVAAIPSFLDPVQHLKEFLRWKDRQVCRPWEARSRAGALYRFFSTSALVVLKAAGLNRKIYRLEPVLSEKADACGHDFDAAWLANQFDVRRLLKEMGMSVRVIIPEGGEGPVARLMEKIKFPPAIRNAYGALRASGFMVVARKDL